MSLKLIVIKIILTVLVTLLDILDKFLQLFGIKLCKITKETLTRGFPHGILDELEKPDIKPFFEEYLKAHERDTELSLSARLIIRHHDLVNLQVRMEISNTIATNPQIKQVAIKKPLFIIGPPRTGTTYLQWLLSQDQQFRSPHFWEWMHPCPPGPVEDYTKDPRYKDTDGFLKFMHSMTGLQHFAAHASEADKADEDLLVWTRSFLNYVLLAQWNAFGDYDKMLLNVGDTRNAFHLYEYHKLQLQLLGYGHDMKNKRYLLKTPYHLLMLESLLQVYPDAEFIFTHRDITQTIPSFVSLIRHLGQPAGARVDNNFIKRNIAVYRSLLERGISSMEKIKNTNPLYFLDYAKFVEDPLREIRKLYDYFHLNLSADAEQKMVDYMDNDQKKKTHAKHKYTIQEFNLTKEGIREEFSALTNRLRLLIEDK